MSIKRRTPLIALCLDAARIRVQTPECGVGASDTTSLRIIQGGCPRYEDVCVEVIPHYGCGVNNMPPQQQIVRREIPRAALTYPLHEIDANGFAVFVLDSKLSGLGVGRYHAQLIEDGVSTFNFDIDLVHGEPVSRAIAVDRANCGGAA